MRRLARIAGFGLVVAAVATELAKPEAERTWHGRVFDLVPYDFRPPTWERIREAYWNPESDKLFSERVFGVGWAINLYRARTLMRGAYERLMGGPEAIPIRMSIRPKRTVETSEVGSKRK